MESSCVAISSSIRCPDAVLGATFYLFPSARLGKAKTSHFWSLIVSSVLKSSWMSCMVVFYSVLTIVLPVSITSSSREEPGKVVWRTGDWKLDIWIPGGWLKSCVALMLGCSMFWLCWDETVLSHILSTSDLLRTKSLSYLYFLVPAGRPFGNSNAKLLSESFSSLRSS